MSKDAILTLKGAAELVAKLRRDIVSSQYRYNQKFPSERELSESLGIPRGTVRAALEHLEMAGFVEQRDGDGIYITYQDEDCTPDVEAMTRPLELMDARFALEPQICRLVVLHATDLEFDTADKVLNRMETCGDDIRAFAQADETFHDLLGQLTQNSLLESIMKKVTELRSHAQWTQMQSLTLTPKMIETYNQQHRAILDALRQRAPERAAGCMNDHLISARDSLMHRVQG